MDKDSLNLCFEGGGIKGVAYVGVARSLESHDIICKKYIGSSAGSIFSGLLACNAGSIYMESAVKTTDFTEFMDGWGWDFGKMYRFGWKMGMYNGDYFMNWYGDHLKILTGNSEITLQEIYDKYQNEIIVTTTDLENRRTIYLNRQNYPDLPLKQAVRMSMSLPIFYVPYWHIDRYFVDGGYLDNYPMDYFDVHYPTEKVLGFKLVGKPKSNKIDGWNSFITNLLEAAVEKIETLETRPEDEDRTVNINTFDISCVDFGIDKEIIEKLIQSGYEATEQYFKKNNSI
jgi:NTE family protein